ncbi:hypothetical protein ISCGN_031445 [Ixodes scapularis]
MGTQTSPDDLHLPSRSPSKPPRAAPVAPPPNRKVNAALPASAPEQEMSSPAQPAALTSRGRGLPPHTSAPQRKPGEVPKQSTSKGQLLATADEPMDEGSVVSPKWLGSVVTLLIKHLAPKVQAPPAELGVRGDATLQTPAFTGSTCESRCLESGVSTDLEPRKGCLHLRCLAVHRGLVRPMVSTGTQTSTDDLRLPSRSPASSGVVPVTPLSNRNVDAASSASTSGQGLTSPAPPGPLAPKGRGLSPRTSAPQRKPGEPPKQSTSRGQLPAATDEPMDRERWAEEEVVLSAWASGGCRKHEERALDPCQKGQLGPLMAPLVPWREWKAECRPASLQVTLGSPVLRDELQNLEVHQPWSSLRWFHQPDHFRGICAKLTKAGATTPKGTLKKTFRQDFISYVTEAWAAASEEIVHRSFKRCGLSTALDDSEDCELREQRASANEAAATALEPEH